MQHSVASSCVCFCLYGPINCKKISETELTTSILREKKTIIKKKTHKNCISTFNFISFHNFFQLSVFSFCSSGLISALLVLSTTYLFMKVSLSPDIILCSLLGLKHQLTNNLMDEIQDILMKEVVRILGFFFSAENEASILEVNWNTK